MKHAHRLLRWLRVEDEDHVFSLTHAFLALACFVYLKHPDAVTAATAAAAVANYSAKNVIRRRASKGQVENDTTQREAQIAALEKQIADVARDVGSIRSGQAWAGVLGKK